MAETDTSTDHAYFFLGNCQTQYLCSVIGSVSTAERSLLGFPFNVNVTLEGARVPYVRGREFQERARRMRARGGRTILLVQETSQGHYRNRITGWGDLFTDVLWIPHLHYRSVWPAHALSKPLADISDRAIRRLPDWEKHEFRGKLQRSGVDAPEFVDAFFETCRRELRFYHPGHPSGPVFADLLRALGPRFAERLPCFDVLVATLDRAMGIYQTCSHPVNARVSDLLDIPWARTRFYRAWQALKTAGDDDLRAAVDEASAILEAPEEMNVLAWPLQAHFRAAIGSANLRLKRQRRALRQLQQAAIELKGFHPVMRIALNQATRAGRWDMAEHMLVEVAPFVVGFRDNSGLSGVLDSLAEASDARLALQRVQDQIAPDTWMHEKIAALLAAKAA